MSSVNQLFKVLLKFFLSIILLLITSIRIISQVETSVGGLRFISQDQKSDNRTAFKLFEDYKTVKDTFKLEFDFRLYDADKFGYFFKIINKEPGGENTLCHLICHPEEIPGNKRLVLYFGSMMKAEFKTPLSRTEWNHFLLYCNLKEKKIHIVFNDQYFNHEYPFPQELTVSILFGSNPPNPDVAAFDLRNVSFNYSKKEKLFWPLDDNSGKLAHELYTGINSNVRNPLWLAKNHFNWTKVLERSFDQMCGIDYDPNKRNIIIVNQDSLVYVNPATNTITTEKYTKKRPFEKTQHYSVFNPRKNELLSYDFRFLKANGQKTYSIYDTITKTWSQPEPCPDQMQNYHHAMFWNHDTTKLISFGGYAHFRYFNDFNIFDFSTNRWEQLNMKGDPIFPRTHVCVGKNTADNYYYLYGGMGNEEGDQALGAKVFYDLYRIDFENNTLKKIWEFKNPGMPFLPRANMVIIPEDSCFYSICGNSDREESSLGLYKFSLNTPGYEMVTDSVPLTFSNMAGNAYLYYNNREKEMYCVIRSTIRNREPSLVTIYKISFPPSKGYSPEGFTTLKHPEFMFLILGGGIILILSIFLYLKKKKKVLQPEAIKFNELEKDDELISLPSSPDEIFKKVSRPEVNAIWLLGKFKIFDRNGRDMSHQFSNKLKVVFYLLFFKTYYKGGINSEDLSDILWPEMDNVRRKNNRGVTFNHLRKIFEDIDGINLTNEDGFWKITTTDEIYVDFIELNRLLTQETTAADTLVSMYALGNLLQNDKYPELDSYKAMYEDHAIKNLVRIGQEFYSRKNYIQAYEISEITHQHFDILNEDALSFKIKALTQLRQHKKAMQEYDKFTQRFNQMMSAKFEPPFTLFTEGIE